MNIALKKAPTPMPTFAPIVRVKTKVEDEGCEETEMNEVCEGEEMIEDCEEEKLNGGCEEEEVNEDDEAKEVKERLVA